MIIKTLLVGAAFFLVMSCGPSSPKLVWSDEFDHGNAPDTTIWNYELGDGCPKLCGWGNNEEEFYTRSKENIRIENGVLVINAIKNGDQWTSARITTKGKRNFTYGRIEFKAKLARGQGTWAALWMLGESIAKVGWPACGEIDILEHVGRNPGVVQSAMHTPSKYGETTNKGDTQIEAFDTEFHIYAADWTKEKIEFSVDGKSYYTYQPETHSAETWPFDAPFYIIMNVAMGGGFGGPIDPDLTSARMEVDYVRVYQ